MCINSVNRQVFELPKFETYIVLYCTAVYLSDYSSLGALRSVYH